MYELQRIAVNEEMITTVSMEGVHFEMYVIRLTFDYVRKDRRDRAYVMEDMDNAKVRILSRICAPKLI